ncbi:DNA helicase ATP-dependent Ku type [Penicillium cf. griseofulvum]|uniref:ATP-dependent DNA helicase II subunit 2 n=1 Tax=Penicillium cf. griseofulvum TaxID=2972120 RepID=A0A9W9IWG8_9EURO|nr:DNA helicase ATP-dependent Ku type [Penicillium cf. griseofulvum]
MAEKEATVYIVDMGRSMGERHHGRPMTDLEWAMQYVWDRITATVATGRKTATVGVVGLRTDETINDLEEENFSNISVLFGLGQVLMPDIRRLRERIKPSKTNKGDAISSIVIAIQMILEYTKKNKYKRKIILVTNGTGVMSDDNIEGIIEKMKEVNIELVIIGADFDDAEYGVKEEDKDSRKTENETLLRSLTEDCDGVYGTLEQAVSELDIPRIKVTKSMPSFKGNLMLGNPEEYDTAITIPVERYFRTYVAKPISASSFVPRSGTEPGSQAPGKGNIEGDALASVRTSRTYQITDESAPGGKVDVERDDLAKGYEYGRTAVPIEETDENVANLQTFAGMGLIGFVLKDQYDRYLHMSNTNIIIPQRANDNASLALSSLIHALYETDAYAVARLVTKESKPPMLVLLAPSIEADYECLIEVQLPFAEDVRSYRFPPLDKIITVSGKVVTEHRNLPSAALKDAMSNYVDSMEFITTNDEGEPTNDLPIDESFSPLLHRIESAVRYRAVHPNDPILDPSERLTEFAHPPEEMVKNAKSHLEKLMSMADVKKVPPRTKGRKRQRETEKPLSGLDVDALLGLEPKRSKISTENAIPEFKQTLSRAENIDAIHDAVQQMAKIIENQVTHSLGHSNYDRVIEGLGTMREELVDYEEPGVYNDFVRQLKGKMLREELGGDRRELWWFVRKGKLGLIGKSEVDSSAVEEEEAQEVRFGLSVWNGTSANPAYSFWLPTEELSGSDYGLTLLT